MKLLLDRGVDVESRDRVLLETVARTPLVVDDATPFVVAIAYNRLEVCKELLARGADVDRSVSNGFTPLMFAVRSGGSHLVEWLLQNGADVALVDVRGNTALHYAALNGDALSVRLLLRYGSSVDSRNAAGWTALTLAATGGNFGSKARELIDLQSLDDERLSSQREAWEAKFSEVIQELLRHGASPLVEGSFGASPLSIALIFAPDDVFLSMLSAVATLSPAEARELSRSAETKGRGRLSRAIISKGSEKLDRNGSGD